MCLWEAEGERHVLKHTFVCVLCLYLCTLGSIKQVAAARPRPPPRVPSSRTECSTSTLNEVFFDSSDISRLRFVQIAPPAVVALIREECFRVCALSVSPPLKVPALVPPVPLR